MSFKTTELCVLVVEETFGELPARVFKALMTYGRQQVLGIVRYTGLTPIQVRHGLAVLIQQHMIQWSNGSSTFYEACWPSAYALLRSGKFSKAAGDRLDSIAEQVLSKSLVDGSTRATDLESLHLEAGIAEQKLGHTNGINGTSYKSTVSHEPYISSIYNLLENGITVLSNPLQYRSKLEGHTRAEKDVRARNSAWADKIKPSDRQAFQNAIQEKLRDWKYGSKSVRNAIQRRGLDEPIDLIQEFKTIEDVHEENTQRPAKRLKTSHDETNGGSFDSELMIRPNHHKYPVLARSQRLIQLAADRIGIPLSKIYANVLHLLDRDIMDCEEFQKDAETPTIDDQTDQAKVGTRTILQALEDFDILQAAIGTPYNTERREHKTNSPSAVKQMSPNKQRRLSDSESHQISRVDLDSDSGSDSDVVQRKRAKTNGKPKDPKSSVTTVNGMEKNKPKTTIAYESEAVTEADGAEDDEKASHLHALRECLLILKDHKLLNHHVLHSKDPGKYSEKDASKPVKKDSSKDLWSVPFASLSHELRVLEINTSIAAHFGTPALRLVRILQEKGKLDEKTLIAQALLDTKVVRSSLTAMHAAGYMELQELPRDNNRAPSKTLYLWFFDEERCARKLLEDHYTAMSRCFQRMKLEREQVKDLLDKTARSDVKGKEKDFLVGEEWNRMERWNAVEEKLLGEIDRLDDAVLVLRDL